MKRGKIIGVLILVFIISVLIRIPNLNRPLSKHHEFITSISLRVLQIWEKDSPANYHYSPVMNYPGKANKWINNHANPTGKMVDEKGNYYYISHPPLAYLLPHYTFKVLKVKPTVLSIQLFLIFCSFLTGIFVYLISLNIFSDKDIVKHQRFALIVYTLYMLSPAVLWFQGNTYMSDILVHTFFASTIYYSIRVIKTNGELKWVTLFSISLFLMIYTSWLGVFMAISIVVIALFRWKNRTIRKLLLPTLLITPITLSLILVQYSSIAGFENLIGQFLQRLDIRGSASSENSGLFLTSKIKEVALLFMNYGIFYFPIFLLLIYSFIRKKNVFSSVNSFIVVLSIIPIVILHFALLNYSGHDFTSLYASLILSIFGGVILIRFSRVKRLLILVFILTLNISSYYYVNRPGSYSWKGDLYASSMQQGLAIKKLANKSKTIFYVTNELDPMIIVYAERNIIPVKNENEIEKHLLEHKITDWQLIKLDE